MTESAQRFMLEPEAIGLLNEYGLPYPDHGLAEDADEAASIAEGLGFPVVLKVVSPDVVHKSDAGGVIVGLEDGSSVRSGYEAMLGRVQSSIPGARIDGVLVCKQAPEGLELIVGALDDATFGPTVMFGLGGVFTETLKDVSFRVAPLERRDAEEMLREIKGYALLEGARGQTRHDVDGIAELLLSVSRLVMDHREIKELDLNPVRLFERGLLVLDVRILETIEQRV
jgi:acyl-CoA synthetase (NDP forming)